jgi:hypothetical protein
MNARATPKMIDSMGNPGMFPSGFPLLLNGDVVLEGLMVEEVIVDGAEKVRLESLKWSLSTYASLQLPSDPINLAP